MRKRVFAVVAVVAVVAIAAWVANRGETLEVVYVLNPKTAVWSRLSVVREALATLEYGERLEVVERREERVRVRTAAGIVGWIDAHNLIPAEIWEKATALRHEANAKPVQASGITKVRTNVRLEPGREGERIFQLLSDTQVEIVARRVAERTQASTTTQGEGADPEAAPAPKKEDWLLIRTTADGREVAGWVLGRFLSPAYPPALVDYAGVNRFVAWFKLAEAQSEFGPRATWLAAGVTGAEGQPCDFTLLRVYTWNLKRSRYETAYVESNLCGRLPIQFTAAAPGDAKGQASFTFTNTARAGEESRQYRLQQNVVRRVRK